MESKKRGCMIGKNIASYGTSLALSLCLLSGCASKAQWAKPGFNPDEFKQDLYLCEREANILASQQAGAMSSAVNPILIYALKKKTFLNNCMEAKGYQQIKGEEAKKFKESLEEPLSPNFEDQKDRWKYIGSTGKKGGNHWFIDTETISYLVKGDVVRVWVRAILDEEGRLIFQKVTKSPKDLKYLQALVDIDCSRCVYKTLKITFHKMDGGLIDSSDVPLDEPWIHIDPGSRWITVYKEICLEKVSPTKPQVTAPQEPTKSAPLTPALSATKIVTVTWTSANIRSGAGNDYPVLTTVKQGDKLTIIGEYQEWFNVRLDNGKEGWVSNRVVK
jgi:hypothetical protein